MLRALPLLALVLLAAGCGRAYTAADVQQALISTDIARVDSHVDSSRSIFATSAAVTDLVIEETPEPPEPVYFGDFVSIELYRNSHDASLAAHSSNGHWFTFIRLPGQHFILRTYANLVFFGEVRHVAAAIALLH